MKNILIVALGVLAILLFSQCSDEDYTGYTTLTATSPTFSVDWGTAPASQVEADSIYTFTITLSEKQVADVVFNISAAASTATEGEDFDLSTHSIVIPAYSTTGSGMLYVYSDVIPEDTEIISIQIGDEKLANVATEPQTRTIEITNLVSNDILVSFNWEDIVDVTIGGTLYEGVSLCANVDIDFLLYDGAGNFISDYTSVSSACPEQYLFDANWAHGDGTFYYAVNLWDNGGVAPDSGPIDFPATINIAQTGVVNITVAQDPSTVLNSSSPQSEEYNVLKVVVSGGTFSFYDAVTDELIFAQ